MTPRCRNCSQRSAVSGEAVERFNLLLNAISQSEHAAGQEMARQGALLGAARSLLDLDRLDEAVAAATELCEASPDNVDALRVLGEALVRKGEHGRAAVVLERARMLSPDDVALLTQLGCAYGAAGDPDGAESALQRALRINPNAVAARTELGRLLVEELRISEALAEFNAALNVLPSYGPAAFGLAALHAQQGHMRLAVHVIVDLLTLDPYNMDALARLAELLEQAGRSGDARIAWQRVLRFQPAHADAQRAVERLGSAGN